MCGKFAVVNKALFFSGGICRQQLFLGRLPSVLATPGARLELIFFLKTGKKLFFSFLKENVFRSRKAKRKLSPRKRRFKKRLDGSGLRQVKTRTDFVQ